MLLPGILIVGLVAIWLLPKIASDVSAAAPRRGFFAGPPLTGREQILHRRLAHLYPNHVIYTHVALSQFIDVIPRAPERQSIQSHFNRHIADFVLCRRDLSIVAVIELDDATDPPLNCREADAYEKAVESAGLRLVRIGAGPLPSQAELQQILQEKSDPGGLPLMPV